MSKYQACSDPLELLRAAYSQGKRVKIKQKHLLFEKNIKISISQPTAWVSLTNKKQYTIGSIWLYLEHKFGNVTDYLSKISQYGTSNVIISDRAEIEDYFSGRKSQSQCINQQIKLQLETKNISNPTQGIEGIDIHQSKKPRPQFIELQVVDFINKFQRSTSSKMKSLRYPYQSFKGLLKILQDSEGRKGEKKGYGSNSK